jgi:hypothetical protein
MNGVIVIHYKIGYILGTLPSLEQGAVMNQSIQLTIPDPLLYLLRFQNLITEDTSHILRILRDINLTLT